MVGSRSVVNTSVPKHPHFLRKRLPSLEGSRRYGFLDVWFDEVYCFALVKMIVDEGSLPNLVIETIAGPF